MRNILAILALIASSSSYSAATWLVKDATIAYIAPVADNQNKFYVMLEGGGTGICANSTIFFPRSAFIDDPSHNRVFSVLLTAMTVGNKVDIYNYINDACSNAGFVLLKKL